MRRIIYIICALLLTVTVHAEQWHADTLGGAFESRYYDQGKSYDGDVRSTLVRLLPREKTDMAVIYIHGFNDYFFQTEMAEQFVDHGYAFFATDLRRYGRSIMEGQKPCDVRSFNEYDSDIDSALNEIRHEGYRKIVMMGHSTGGLVAAYYLARNKAADVDALILNSPFLDWNLGKMECVVGIASTAGKLFPNIPISSGSGTAYGESLNRNYHGEWEFDTTWKSITPRKVTLGWVNAVNSAQKYLRKHRDSIDMPILLMYSARSIDSEEWSTSVDSADAVLDVADIRKYGLMLGKDVTPVRIEGGRHDLVLSVADVRYPLYNYIFGWIRKNIGSD
ncbi:MAG: alpha/beta hydrolase [Bacteroides sp.]|nr:alpha/beta hydrolase [Bacteroides sp.]